MRLCQISYLTFTHTWPNIIHRPSCWLLCERGSKWVHWLIFSFAPLRPLLKFSNPRGKRKWNWLSDFPTCQGKERHTGLQWTVLSWLTPIRRVILLKLDFRSYTQVGFMNMTEYREFINKWWLHKAYVTSFQLRTHSRKHLTGFYGYIIVDIHLCWTVTKYVFSTHLYRGAAAQF